MTELTHDAASRLLAAKFPEMRREHSKTTYAFNGYDKPAKVVTCRICRGLGYVPQVELESLLEAMAALQELVDVAELRGDSTLPLPEDDERLWNARMQTAWYEARAVLDDAEGIASCTWCLGRNGKAPDGYSNCSACGGTAIRDPKAGGDRLQEVVVGGSQGLGCPYCENQVAHSHETASGKNCPDRIIEQGDGDVTGKDTICE